jgi:hypothetical protein
LNAYSGATVSERCVPTRRSQFSTDQTCSSSSSAAALLVTR